MVTSGDPDDPGLADLTIEVAVERNQTKTVHRVKKGATLMFNNGMNDMPLTIESPSAKKPFVLPDCTEAVSEFTVRPHANLTVTISKAYEVGERFTYTAQVEGSDPEDPIVIIERR